MSFTEFFKVAKESNYNLSTMFEKAPNETLISFGIVLVVILVIVFFIRKAIKENIALKTVNSISDSKTVDDYISKVKFLVDELPKRGEKVASELNRQKEHILFRVVKLFEPLTIKEKIEKLQKISKLFKDLSSGSKKYQIEDLSSYFDIKSKELLEKELSKEIEFFYKSSEFNESEIENLNAIITYANSLDNPTPIIEAIKHELNRFSFGYNLALFKFIEKLDKDNSKQIFEFCSLKIEEYLTSGEKELSINILEYLYEKDEKQKVYDYISSLNLDYYLQQLYYLLFNKKDDLNLDLAFIANPVKIDNEYKNYIDYSLTNNWKDKEHIEFVSKSKGVIEVLGHVEFRTLIERVDNIGRNEENTKKIDEALAIAKRAESMAVEALSLNKKPIK